MVILSSPTPVENLPWKIHLLKFSLWKPTQAHIPLCKNIFILPNESYMFEINIISWFFCCICLYNILLFGVPVTIEPNRSLITVRCHKLFDLSTECDDKFQTTR